MAKKDDVYYMKRALVQARKALSYDEVPIGAVVVDGEGVIVGRGYNRVEQKGCQSAHAEMRAIERACAKRGDWRLDDCQIYVTLEPCAMCMGLIRLSRIGRVVFGADSPLFGYRLDNERSAGLYSKKPLALEQGVLKDESVAVLRQFFKQKRKK